MSLNKISVDKMSVDEMSVDKMPLDKMQCKPPRLQLPFNYKIWVSRIE